MNRSDLNQNEISSRNIITNRQLKRAKIQLNQLLLYPIDYIKNEDVLEQDIKSGVGFVKLFKINIEKINKIKTFFDNNAVLSQGLKIDLGILPKFRFLNKRPGRWGRKRKIVRSDREREVEYGVLIHTRCRATKSVHEHGLQTHSMET